MRSIIYIFDKNKLKVNENWYFIEQMIMTYVNIKLNEETYKYISTRVNKIFARRYLIVNKMFNDLKKNLCKFE
jgi:hypothetical protein